MNLSYRVVRIPLTPGVVGYELREFNHATNSVDVAPVIPACQMREKDLAPDAPTDAPVPAATRRLLALQLRAMLQALHEPVVVLP